MRTFGRDVVNRTVTVGNTVTLTTAVAHNLSIGAVVDVAIGDAAFDGLGLTVTAVPAFNQLQYARILAPVVNQKSFTGTSATLQTATAHNLHLNDVLNVTGVDGLFNGSVTVTALPTTTSFSYTPSLSVPNVNAKAYSGGVVTITTETPHNFASGYAITLANVDPLVANGARTISATPSGSVFQFNRNNVATVDQVAFASDVATYRTTANHGFTVGNTVVIANVDPDLNGSYYITGVPSTTTFTVSRPFTATVVNKALSAGVATITTSGSHSLIVGDQVVVTTGDTAFDGTFTITAATSTTFSYARALSAAVANRALASDVATINTATAHNLQIGNTVTISAVDPVFNGPFTVTGVPTSTRFTYARPFTSSVNNKSFSGGNAATLVTTAAHSLNPGDQVLIGGIDTIFNGGPYTITSVPAANSFTYNRPVSASVVNKSLVNNVVTLATSAPHNLVPGASINVSLPDGLLDGTYTVVSTPTTTTLTYAKPFSAPITQKQLSGGNLATITTAFNHGFVINDQVTITSVDPVFDGGPYTITAVGGGGTTFSYARTVSANVATKAISGGNLATITTASAHKLQTGDQVSLAGVDNVFNGLPYTVTVVNGTTFTFPRTYTATSSYGMQVTAVNDLADPLARLIDP